MTRRSRGLRALAVSLGASVAAGACGGTPEADNAAACSPVEQVIESGGIHVLPGTETSYDLSPPTSGPHQLPAPRPGTTTDPIAEPLQVSALESGMVILHYVPALPDAERTALEALSSPDGVIVAPAARPLDAGALVAFTAWGTRQLCRALDIELAESFVSSHLEPLGGNHR